MSVVGIDKLSKEAREAIQEFKEDLKPNLKDVQILREGSGNLWEIRFQFVDDDGKPVANEVYMTVKGHSRLVAQFIVGFDEDGKPDDGDWSPMWLAARVKNLSDFVIAVIEYLAPHPFTIVTAGLEGFDDDECSCGIDDDDDEDMDHVLCAECEEEDCDGCVCDKCEEDDCEGCDEIEEDDDEDKDDGDE